MRSKNVGAFTAATVSYPVMLLHYFKGYSRLTSVARFTAKHQSSLVEDVLQWSTQGDKRVVACLTATADSCGEAPPIDETDHTVCALTLFTQTTEAKLKPRFGYMSQNHETWADHFFFEILSGGGAMTGFFPDAGARIWMRKCKLVYIGRCSRPWLRDSESEYIVLVLEQKGSCYERRGLTTVRESDFDWNLEWIDIV